MVTLKGASSRMRVVVSATMLAVSASTFTLVAASPAAAHTGRPHWCQCVDYIKHLYGFGQTGNARFMGDYLLDHRFEKLPAPKVGAVVVFQPEFGVNRAGHVGIIQSVSSRGDQWRLKVRGARQGGSETTRSNCTNVSDVLFRWYDKTSNAVAYYKKP